MLKFGAVTIDVSHPKTFSTALAQEERARYTAVFNDGFRGDDEVQAFAELYNVNVCSSLEELADQVDLGIVHACNWDKHLGYLAPFIDRNKPVYIDKPLVGNLADGRKLLELSKAGAKIIGTSALRYSSEIHTAKAEIAANDAKIMHVNVAVGNDDFNYGIHALETLCAIIDEKPVSVKCVGTAEKDGVSTYTYFFTFEGGVTATFQNSTKKASAISILIIPNKGGNVAFTPDTKTFYACMMNQICNYMEGKENILASVEEMLIPITLALACKLSRMTGGEEIRLDDPRLEDVSFDGYEFERGYAATAAKLFVKP